MIGWLVALFRPSGAPPPPSLVRYVFRASVVRRREFAGAVVRRKVVPGAVTRRKEF